VASSPGSYVRMKKVKLLSATSDLQCVTSICQDSCSLVLGRASSISYLQREDDDRAVNQVVCRKKRREKRASSLRDCDSLLGIQCLSSHPGGRAAMPPTLYLLARLTARKSCHDCWKMYLGLYIYLKAHPTLAQKIRKLLHSIFLLTLSTIYHQLEMKNAFLAQWLAHPTSICILIIGRLWGES
jgi:hypothetical protein